MTKPYSKMQSVFKEEKPKKEKAKPKPIPKKSKKLIDAEKIYNKERKKYLQAYPYCEVSGCNKESQDIHHRKGRVGALLSDSKYFMSVCRPHHVWIEEHPLEAKAKGYSISRL